MEELTWEVCRKKIDEWSKDVEEHLNKTAQFIQLYRQTDDGEKLNQILSELNYRSMCLGDYQAKYKRLELWTDRRYDIEKGIETVRIVREEKKAVNFAQVAKNEHIQKFLSTLVDAAAMHMRVQNARSSARDTTDAIRQRISQLKYDVRNG